VNIRIAHEISGTEAEGPGRRYAVWLQGCPIRCASCCNPELFTERGGDLVSPSAIAERVSRADVEGITVLGGEPFAQAPALRELVEGVRRLGRSVVVFTGYTLEELRGRDADTDAALAAVDVLVDGRYDASLPERHRRWIGSSNQRIWFFTERYSDRDFRGANTVELRLEGGVLTVNGWPAPSVAG
jgi:anaerobic ribonucleoside-triphosphate reductase activating protein